jgi:hypothetical protein
MAAARQVLGLGAQAKQAMDSTSSSKSIAFYREVCSPQWSPNWLDLSFIISLVLLHALFYSKPLI